MYQGVLNELDAIKASATQTIQSQVTQDCYGNNQSVFGFHITNSDTINSSLSA